MNIQLKNSGSIVLLTMILWIFFTGCQEDKRTDIDTPNSGTIHISVDESFKPVIDSQIQVFEALYPKAKIIADYKPEAECFKDLLKDSTRMIIVTRGLTDQEEKFYKDSFTFYPSFAKIAYDAIAVIVNNNDPDSLFSMDKIFVKPYQANILTKRYPMVRGLYFILKENYDGLGGGFSNFLQYERGQLIFRRAYLGPAKINFSIRSATLNTK